MAMDGEYRPYQSQAITLQSVGGAAVSTAVFGAQTYAIDLAYAGSVSSTAGVRFKIVSGQDTAVSSTQGALLPPSWIARYKVTPGSRVSAISNDAGTPSLTIVELTK